MEIIDFHTHPFREGKYCLNFYAERNAEQMRKELQDAGITRICGSVLRKDIPPRDFLSVKALNREALALREQLGSFYTPGFHVHPGYPEESCEEIDFMHRQGVRLMGELVPYMHGWGDFPESSWLQILALARDRNMIISYHTPFDYDMRPALKAHPDMIFVAAHPGDRDRVGAMIALMKQHDNLYLDLSGTGLFRLGLVRHLIDEVGADRILFGSDYPICNPRMYVQAILGENLTEDEREKILYRNAARLLK